MTQPRACPRCGATLPTGTPPETCPRCLMGIGLEDTPAARAAGRVPTAEELAPHFPQLEIGAQLGRGGMGVVYAARQRELDRQVALKILTVDPEKDPTFAERFAREARALASLNHPHIVAVHDSGRAGAYYYLLMEHVDGVDLRRLIDAGQVAPKEALELVSQISGALQYAHEEGVVHRDIKPENILVDRRGRVKIADFGLAKLLGGAPEEGTLTGTHQAMGTWHYMAPEQIEHPLEVDHRADIYSLGVVFYELLTGELPLGRFQAPSGRVRVDVRVDEVVLRSLEKQPERRYQHASEVQTDVDRIQEEPARAAAQPAADAPREPRTTHAGRASKDSQGPVIAGLVLALFGLAPLAVSALLLIDSVRVPWVRGATPFSLAGVVLVGLALFGLALLLGGVLVLARHARAFWPFAVLALVTLAGSGALLVFRLMTRAESVVYMAGSDTPMPQHGFRTQVVLAGLLGVAALAVLGFGALASVRRGGRERRRARRARVRARVR